MKTITQQELNAMLTNCAKCDLTQARRSGSLVVTNTKVGNVDLRYDKPTKTYSVIKWNAGGKVLCGPVKAADVTTYLVGIYQITLDQTEVVG